MRDTEKIDVIVEPNGNELDFIRDSAFYDQNPYKVDKDLFTTNFIEDFERIFFTPQPKKGMLFDTKI